MFLQPSDWLINTIVINQSQGPTIEMVKNLINGSNSPNINLSSIENFYVDINLSLIGRLFPSDLFEKFIDVGHYVRELNAYKPLVDKISTLTVNNRGIVAR